MPFTLWVKDGQRNVGWSLNKERTRALIKKLNNLRQLPAYVDEGESEKLRFED